MSAYTETLQSSPQSIFETSTTDHHAVGSRIAFGGRVFRYASQYDTTAIGPNKLAQQCVPVTAHVVQTGALTGTATVGAKRVTITLGATAAYANEYRNGYLKIQSATTGAGQIFKLKEHAAVALSGVLTADIYDPVVTATSGTTTWTLMHEAWGSVLIHPATTATAGPAGVTMCNWAAATSTAPNFGWLQTWGVGSLFLDTTPALVVGSGVVYGVIAGAAKVAVETDIKARIGIALETLATASTYASVFLQIAP